MQWVGAQKEGYKLDCDCREGLTEAVMSAYSFKWSDRGLLDTR